MMGRPRFIVVMALLAIVSLFLGIFTPACRPEYTIEESEKIARNFVRNEATFRFDGISETLQLADTTALGPGSWEFVFRYDSRAAGHGDRTGQVLPQVITPHEARVTVTNYKITRGALDDEWDMMNQQLGVPPAPKPAYTVFELEYLLIAKFGNVFYVDPDFYPVAREGQEETNARQQFAAIRANADEFAAILAHLGLPDKSDYTDEEKLLIYREHKKLVRAVEMSATGNTYHFVLLVGEDQGERIEGTITGSGEITVTKREPSFNTYPICLAGGILIDTPGGPMPVEQVRKGTIVWTIDDSGERLAATVVETSTTPVPPSFRVVTVTLSDGRRVIASPGHPTADGKALGSYQPGDTLDGAWVVTVERVDYLGGATYDILPAGPTGLYRANGVLLKSTLGD